MEPLDIEMAAIACQSVAAITQTAHLIALLEKGVKPEKAKKIVLAQIEHTAQTTAPELVNLLKHPGDKISPQGMKTILLRAINLAKHWLENSPPPEKEYYESPDGYHRHRCMKCLHIWEHENANLKTGQTTMQEEHLCPGCGQQTGNALFGFHTYDGPLPPNTTTRK